MLSESTRLSSISLDTNVIDRCIDNNISATELNTLLKNKGFFPVVNLYVFYELARMFVTNFQDKAVVIFSFIRDLQPIFCCRPEILLSMECRKIQFGETVQPFAAQSFMQHINKRIQDYSNGRFESFDAEFISERQSAIEFQRRNTFVPCGNKEKIKDRYENDFSKVILQYVSNLMGHRETIENLIEIIHSYSLQKIKINENDIKHFANNIVVFISL